MKKLQEAEIQKIIRLAQQAQERAYCPYSHYSVGACLQTNNGAYYQGCNIENAAFTPGICAERTALFTAVYQGERGFEALAVATDSDDFASPCGVCRQALVEFCDLEMLVICANKEGKYRMVTLGELLPYAFTGKELDL